MGRAPCFNKNELKKVPWTPEEDQKLTDYIQKHGHGSWRSLPNNAGLSRCGKSCRLRRTNYLRPDNKRGRFSFEEEETIIQLHRILGNKWSAIAARLPGRTDTEIKNYWNTHIRKRLHQIGIDSSSGLGRSSYNPAQLLISRLLGIKTLLDSKLAEMATINLLLSQYQYPNLPLQAEQHLYDSQNQEQLIPCFENATPEIPTACNSQLVDAADQMQDNWTNRDFTENFELEPYRIAESSGFHVANNQSWYSHGSSLSKQELCPTHLSAPLSCINSSNIEGKDDDDDFSEVFNLQIPELLDVSDLM